MANNVIVLPDRLMVDLALQYLEVDQLKKLHAKLVDKLAGAYNLYKMPEPWFFAQPTDTRVSGANPPCGNGEVQLGDEVKVVAKLISGLGNVANAVTVQKLGPSFRM